MGDELDRLRSALQEPPGEDLAEPDLDRIFAEGGRIRRRRRFLTSAGAAVAVVTVVFGAVWLRTPGAPQQPSQQLQAAAAPSAMSSAPPSVPLPTTTTVAGTESRPLGEMIPTGSYTDGAELVFYATEIDDPKVMPDIQFGVVAGLHQRTGELKPLYFANETEGSDRSFGFHATSGGMTVSDTWVPVYGYFAGPAARITTTVKGRPIDANLARWSQDPDVVVFWFNQKDVPSADQATPLVAYSADGTRLTK